MEGLVRADSSKEESNLNAQEKANLYQGMKESAKVFCEDEGIPVPAIGFHSLGDNVYGEYRHKYGLIVIDPDKENDYVSSFFHELIHHWQWSKMPKWYEKSYGWWTRKVSHKASIDVYANSRIEVEARSFARSIVEDLDQD